MIGIERIPVAETPKGPSFPALYAWKPKDGDEGMIALFKDSTSCIMVVNDNPRRHQDATPWKETKGLWDCTSTTFWRRLEPGEGVKIFNKD